MKVDSEYFAQGVQGEYETYSHQRRNSGIALSLSSPAFTTPSLIISISELLWKNFQLVDIDSARKKTLFALALTCQSFTGMALDLLWRNLDSLSPLLGCLQPSLWEVYGQELNFLRAMTFDDWSIFCKYNHRVRSLAFCMNLEPYRVSAEIWRTLGCPPFSLPLLPNLTSLSWNTPSGTFPYIRLFVTHKLTTLNIYAHYSEIEFGPSVQSILSCISKLCPSVSHFSFHNYQKSGDASIALQCWSLLTTARTGWISNATILHLSNLPSLRELHLELDPTPIAADTQKLLQHPVFCALQELDIECRGLSPLNAFFKTLSIAPKTLSFYSSEGEDSPRALPVLISRISNACAHDALEHLCATVHDADADFSTSISAAAFQPLFAFYNLRKFDFYSEYDVQLDDATLLQMARAWPLLEQLRIHGEHSSWSTHWHHATTNSLISLLQYCPHLTSVAIAIDWSAVDRPDVSLKIPHQGFAHKALSCADFGSSRIYYSTAVAAFISAVAPNLERIVGWNFDCHFDHPDYERFNSRWKTVHRLAKAFSIIREQGRRMGSNAAIGGDFSAGGEDSEEDNRRESNTASESHCRCDCCDGHFLNEEYEE